MNILVLGATGFLGSHIVTALLEADHAVTCGVRDIEYAKNLFPSATYLKCDFIKDNTPHIWIDRLKNIDVVINCVGILYHPNSKIIWATHYDTPKAIYEACKQSAVKKIIHISALGSDKGNVDYATSKKALDDFLLSSGLPAIVLRPSLLYAKGSFGGTSLFRGLAGLPFVIPVPGKGEQLFQPLHLDDLAKSICILIKKPLEKPLLMTAVGPEMVSLKNILTTLRAWLGFSKAHVLFIPLFFIQIASLFGSWFANSTLNKTSFKMMQINNIATDVQTQEFHNTIGFVPQTFQKGLYRQPSSVQDHWHAHLYFVKPLLQYSLAFIWIWSGLCTAFFMKPAAQAMLEAMAISSFWQPIIIYTTSLFDAAIGLAFLLDFQLRKIALLQFAAIIIYTLILTFTLPLLWIHPLAPLAKNIPILVTILAFIAVESDK